MSDGKNGLQLRSLIKKSGELEISLVDVPTPEPAADGKGFRRQGRPRHHREGAGRRDASDGRPARRVHAGR